MSASARWFAALVMTAAIVSLGMQFAVTFGLLAEQGKGVAATVWLLAGYFTILTNVLVALTMAAITTGNWPIGGWRSSSLLGALALCIAVVGLVYHLVLARTWNPQGWAFVADAGLHTLVPVLMLIFWAVYAPKQGLRWHDAALWLVYPLGYCAYALARGALTGWYPYPFLDVSQIGATQVVINCIVLTGGFFLMGLIVITSAHHVGARGKSLNGR